MLAVGNRGLGECFGAPIGAVNRPRDWRVGTRIGLTCAALALSACTATAPLEPVQAPRVEGLPELMHQAETAAAAGDKDKAREAYRAAAKVEPTSKLPWLKLSQSYFDAGDYGNAILAAQEVLHRDDSDGPDSAAAGILAASGMRVSTTGLGVLRKQNDLPAGTRAEAEALSKNLRDLLGEATPSTPAARDTAAAVRAKVKPRARAVAPAVAASAPSVPAAAAAAAGASPFDKLK